MQNQMCDMIKEIEKERDMCKAQIENKTTGMPFSCVCVCVCLTFRYCSGCTSFNVS